jgi:hypothetical protein
MSATRSRISANAGVFDFISLRGPVNRIRQTLQEITRPGVDGHAYRLTGRRGDPFEMTAIRDFDREVDGSSAALQAQIVSLQQACGTLATVLDDFGNSYSSVMILDVQLVDQKPATKSAGGMGTLPDRIVASFRVRMQHTNTAAP